MAQLARIEAAVKKRWGSKEDPQDNREKSKVEDDKDNKEGSEDGSRKS